MPVVDGGPVLSVRKESPMKKNSLMNIDRGGMTLPLPDPARSRGCRHKAMSEELSSVRGDWS